MTVSRSAKSCSSSGALQILDLTSTPADMLRYAVLKRGVRCRLLVAGPHPDHAASSPWLLCLIRLSSPGPVFFKQERIGLNGEMFRMYKFRTMSVSAKNESDTALDQRQRSAEDPPGTFLRRTSIDELPQFFNVLKGEMSVVGPRPERPYFVDKFLGEVRRYNQRHSLKVGITGWAQVHGWRGDTSIQERVEHDLYYLHHWSLGFDLRIVAMTVLSALTNKNAY